METIINLVQILIWRTERSAPSRSLSTSRISRIAILLAGICSSLAKGRAYQRLLNQCVKDDSGNVFCDFGMLNTVSGKEGVMTSRNMQRVRTLDAFEQFRRQQWNVDRHCFIRHSASLTKMVWVVNSHIRG